MEEVEEVQIEKDYFTNVHFEKPKEEIHPMAEVLLFRRPKK